MCAHCTSKLFFKGGDGLCAACPGSESNNDFSGNTIYYVALTLVIMAILVVSFARRIVKEKARQFEEYKEAQMNTMMHKAGMSDEDICSCSQHTARKIKNKDSTTSQHSFAA
jgi:hypothetical protein